MLYPYKVGDLVLVRPLSNPEGLLGVVKKLVFNDFTWEAYDYYLVEYLEKPDNFGRVAIHCDIHDPNSIECKFDNLEVAKVLYGIK